MSSRLLGRLDPARSEYLRALRERVVVFDGATGTNLHVQGLGAERAGGAQLDGCSEILVVSDPASVERLHRSFLEVGVDVIETNTFCASSVALGQYGLAARARELNLAAAAIARRVADEYAAPGAPRWVAGSIGPGTKFPTLGQIPYEELRAAYEEQALALLEGGVDLLLIETVFDLLSAKAAINGARRAMAALGRQVPLQVQVTIEGTGRMLPGTEIGAVDSVLDAMQVDVVGLNCGLGPAGMDEAVRYLCAHSRVPVSVMPSAGLPTVVKGETHDDLSPDQLADHLQRFATEYGAEAVGGCCGTTPAHLRAVVKRLGTTVRSPREPVHVPAAASIFRAVPFGQGASVLAVGERTSAIGSRRFRDAMREGDWDACVAMARDQVAEGAHMIDVCVDDSGANGIANMTALASRLCTQSSVPLMIESTEPPVVESALRWLGGRPVLNSVDLGEGEGEGSGLDRFLRLAREYGAAVVCACVGEDGTARTAERKLHVARAICDIAVDRYGLEPSDLLIDPLVLPLSTGREESRRDGVETLDAIAAIKAALPGTHTIIGLSDVSVGLTPASRQVLNSVFLHECVDAGLDAAILHSSKVLAFGTIDEHVRQVCLDLVYDRRRESDDPLGELSTLFAGRSTSRPTNPPRR